MEELSQGTSALAAHRTIAEAPPTSDASTPHDRTTVSTPEHPPLPVSKHTRVYFEVVRTFAAVSAVAVNCLTCLKVFGVL